ncbi:MAG: type II secretion system F family protein [bacterium]
MKLQYRARTKDGELQVGIVEAISREVALNMLADHDLYVLSLHETKEGKWYENFLDFFNRVRIKDLMIFTRQFAALLAAEISLSDALRTMQRQTRNVKLRDILFDVSSDIDAGLSFSQSIMKYGTVFSPFYINMIRSSEVTGRMEEAVSFLADYLEKQAYLISRVRNALIYPTIMIISFVIVAGIMSAVVLPGIAPMFREAGVELPLFTQILLRSSEILAEWWFAIVGVIITVLFILIDYFRTDEGRVVVDEISLRVPVVGSLLRQMYVSRFTESVSVLLKGGIPVSQALEIAGQTIGSVVYRDILMLIAEDVRRGEMLSSSLATHEHYFPPMVSQMVAIGEKTGRLEELLGRVASFYMREVDSLVNNLVELVQPILMIVIGILVGLLFASILKPIYGLVQSFT